MGEKVRVGSFTYDVLEANWKSQLGESVTARTPERNFLLVRLSITNSGGEAATVPTFQLENSSGDTYPESQNGANVPHWLGLLRRLEPAQTEDGTLLFDVPTNTYRLRITDGVDGGKVFHVNIPLRLDSAS